MALASRTPAARSAKNIWADSLKSAQTSFGKDLTRFLELGSIQEFLDCRTDLSSQEDEACVFSITIDTIFC